MADFKAERSGTTLNIVLGKYLNSKSAPELEEAIMSCVQDVDEINFDLVNLELLTSAGLRILLTALQEMDDKGGTMTLRNVSDYMKSIFEMTGFISFLTIVE